jgi:hypothetical protein
MHESFVGKGRIIFGRRPADVCSVQMGLISPATESRTRCENARALVDKDTESERRERERASAAGKSILVARGMRPSSEPASWPGVPCTATSYIVPALLIAAAKGGRDFIIAFENVSLS